MKIHRLLLVGVFILAGSLHAAPEVMRDGEWKLDDKTFNAKLHLNAYGWTFSITYLPDSIINQDNNSSHSKDRVWWFEKTWRSISFKEVFADEMLAVVDKFLEWDSVANQKGIKSVNKEIGQIEYSTYSFVRNDGRSMLMPGGLLSTEVGIFRILLQSRSSIQKEYHTKLIEEATAAELLR